MDITIEPIEVLQKDLLMWTKLDVELRDLNKKCTEIRKKKDILQSRICPIIQSENLEDNIFSIPALHTNVLFKEQSTGQVQCTIGQYHNIIKLQFGQNIYFR